MAMYSVMSKEELGKATESLGKVMYALERLDDFFDEDIPDFKQISNEVRTEIYERIMDIRNKVKEIHPDATELYTFLEDIEFRDWG